MTTSDETTLSLVQAATIGRDFYRSARFRVQDESVAATFANLAGAKHCVVSSLAALGVPLDVEAPAFAAPGDAASDAIADGYRECGAKIGGEADRETLAELAVLEARLLTLFEKALSDCGSEGARAPLKLNLPRVRACAEQIRELEQSRLS